MRIRIEISAQGYGDATREVHLSNSGTQKFLDEVRDLIQAAEAAEAVIRNENEATAKRYDARHGRATTTT